MKFILKNKYIILIITILSCLMFYFIGEKQGFHEDEIFSIGSSNYRYDNVYRSFGYAEANQDVFYNQILAGKDLDSLPDSATKRILKELYNLTDGQGEQSETEADIADTLEEYYDH